MSVFQSRVLDPGVTLTCFLPSKEKTKGWNKFPLLVSVTSGHRNLQAILQMQWAMSVSVPATPYSGRSFSLCEADHSIFPGLSHTAFRASTKSPSATSLAFQPAISLGAFTPPPVPTSTSAEVSQLQEEMALLVSERTFAVTSSSNLHTHLAKNYLGPSEPSPRQITPLQVSASSEVQL